MLCRQHPEEAGNNLKWVTDRRAQEQLAPAALAGLLKNKTGAIAIAQARGMLCDGGALDYVCGSELIRMIDLFGVSLLAGDIRPQDHLLNLLSVAATGDSRQECPISGRSSRRFPTWTDGWPARQV